jgi:hypothetical protein
MASRARTVAATFALALLACAGAAALQREQSGQFALYRGTPKIRSDVRLIDSNELQIVQYPLHAATAITQYRSLEGEPVHVVLVRDDFRSFSHVHPRTASGGTFHVRVALDAGHRYYAFVGSEPVGDAPQVFRFTLKAGVPPRHIETTFDAPSTRAIAGPYRVTLSTARLSKNQAQTIEASVAASGGAPVHTYPFRGAQAHTVFINVQTLQYVHVDAPRIGDRIHLRVPPLTRGAYRMWLEFNDGRAIFAAPFTLVAR